mmetsp:Transcript_4740/g.7336  ORF Transcript_4740/g.7336 Transcript_4740/m.7336 type:complete len:630 (+) Transcript_4740:147-2036(+)
MKKNRKTQTQYSQSIESHWDLTMEFERISVNPDTILEQRNPKKENDLDSLSSINEEKNYFKSYWDIDIIFEKVSMHQAQRNLQKDTERNWDSYFNDEEDMLYRTPDVYDIDSHWDSTVELERVSIGNAPTSDERYKRKLFFFFSLKYQLFNPDNLNFPLILIATFLSLVGFTRIFKSQSKKKKPFSERKKRHFQDSLCKNSCSPTERTDFVSNIEVADEVQSSVGDKKISIADKDNCTESLKIDFCGYINKRQTNSIATLYPKEENKGERSVVNGVHFVTCENRIRKELPHSQEACEKLSEEPTATTGTSSVVVSQPIKESSTSRSIAFPTISDGSRRGSRFSQQHLEEMSKEIEMMTEVFGVEGAQQFVQQRHLLEYQEYMRREHDNKRLSAEFQVRRIEMHNTERRHQEVMAKQDDDQWASKCIQIRNQVVYHLQRTTIWLVVLIFVDAAAKIGLETIRSDLQCACQPNPSSASVKILLCNSISPSSLCQLAQTCWIGCASSWSIWIIVLLIARFAGLKFSDTIACGVGILLWKQVYTEFMNWCIGYCSISAVLCISFLVRWRHIHNKLRFPDGQRITGLADYELECDQFKIGILVLVTTYFCFFQVVENGFLQQCARTYISYEYYE